MAIRRQTTAAQQVAPSAPAPQVAQQVSGAMHEGINFGDLSFYSAGFLIPAGKYCLTDLSVVMFKGEKSTAAPRLGVQITAVPLNAPTEDNKKQQFYSMGTNMDKSYAPNPQTGKGIVPIPGAPAATAPSSSNWAIFLKSLYDGGLPPGVFTNDTSTLEGIWVHITHIDEPEERSSFATSNSAEVSQERRRNKIAVVLEVLDGGKPWEGTGGWPDAPVIFVEDEHPARLLPTPTPVKPAPRVNGVAGAAVDSEDVKNAAINGVSDVLEKNTKGCTKLLLRTSTFASVAAKRGEQMAGHVLGTYFDPAGALDLLLGEVGYKVSGAMVVPA